MTELKTNSPGRPFLRRSTNLGTDAASNSINLRMPELRQYETVSR